MSFSNSVRRRLIANSRFRCLGHKILLESMPILSRKSPSIVYRRMSTTATPNPQHNKAGADFDKINEENISIKCVTYEL